MGVRVVDLWGCSLFLLGGTAPSLLCSEARDEVSRIWYAGVSTSVRSLPYLGYGVSTARGTRINRPVSEVISRLYSLPGASKECGIVCVRADSVKKIGV